MANIIIKVIEAFDILDINVIIRCCNNIHIYKFLIIFGTPIICKSDILKKVAYPDCDWLLGGWGVFDMEGAPESSGFFKEL